MRFDEYRKHDAISLAELIAKRQISAEEVLEAAIARAELPPRKVSGAIAHNWHRGSTAPSPAAAQPHSLRGA